MGVRGCQSRAQSFASHEQRHSVEIRTFCTQQHLLGGLGCEGIDARDCLEAEYRPAAEADKNSHCTREMPVVLRENNDACFTTSHFGYHILCQNAIQCNIDFSLQSQIPHILYSFPWKGLHTPLTLSFKLRTGFVTLFNFSPFALRSNIALLKISFGSMFRTQMAFSRPLI